MLRCTSKRVVYRCGRRFGKCFNHTTIQDSNHGLLESGKLLEMYKKGIDIRIRTYNQNTGELTYSPAHFEDNGFKEIYVVKTLYSRKEETTSNHPFLIWRDHWDEPRWIDASKLLIGDLVAIPNKESQFGSLSYTEDKLRALLLEDYSIGLPLDVFQLDRNSLVQYLNLLLGSEYLTVIQGDIKYKLVIENEGIYDGLRRILINFNINFMTFKIDNEYIISITNIDSLNRLRLLLGLPLINKQYAIQWTDFVPPGIWNNIKSNNFSYSLLKSNLYSYLKVDNNSNLLKYTTDDISWDIITSIEKRGKSSTIAIEVEDTHTIANEMITHNTDVFAVLSLFYAITNPLFKRDSSTGKLLRDKNGELYQKNTAVLIIAPRQIHADNLMKAVNGFIKNNPLLQESIVSSVKSPYYKIEFTTGSTITCITAATGSAGAGLSIRSHSADVLFLDEGNYLESPELKAAKAILATNQYTILKVASTPVGVKDFFWEWCFAKPGYKAFYFPSCLLPHWELIKDEIYEDIDTEDEFHHEYMARFSASEQGVFRIDLIEKASKNYHYNEVDKVEGWLYSLGVDWNSNAGTEIIVLGYDPKANMYQVVDAINIPKSQWTQLTAVEKLIELITYWDIDVTCLDEGYGHTQIEIIKRYAYENAHKHSAIANLNDNLIAYAFGSKIITINPVDGSEKKRPAKPFLVNNAVRRLEEETIIVSAYDTVLLKQMNHYEVLSVSKSTGLPIYGIKQPGIGDHRLDAFMLAIMGFRLKYNNMIHKLNSVDNIFTMKTKQIKVSSRSIVHTSRRQSDNKRFRYGNEPELLHADGPRQIGNRKIDPRKFNNRYRRRIR